MINRFAHLPYIYDTISTSYDARGNVLSRGGFTANYGTASDPYAVSYAEWDEGTGWTEQYAPRYASLMTSFDRPAAVADTLNGDCFAYATYEYDASGRKARSTLTMIDVDRTYMGDVFEMDFRSWGDPDDPWGPPPGSETTQRLFLGGSAYDAPMVLV